MAQGKKTGGRVAGTPNKATKAVKDAVIEAFELAGGVGYLVQVAKDDPKTFLSIVAKVIPLQVEGAGANGEIVFKTVYEAK